MDFAEAMESIEGLAGIEVAATIWGLGDDQSFVAILGGLLSAQQHFDSGVPDSGMVDTDGETAVTFGIGDHWGNELSFWPSRFVSAERHADDPGVTIITLDAKVVVTQIDLGSTKGLRHLRPSRLLTAHAAPIRRIAVWMFSL